jgi:MATE family multidrug resistance protein
MFKLAAPLALQQAGNHLMGLVDSAMLGRWSDAALAGAGVGNNIYFGLTCIGLGTIMGMDAVVPQALGAGRHEDARRAVGAGVRLAVIVGLLTTLVTFASPLLLAAARVEPDVLFEARAFIYMRALGAVPFLIAVALRTYLTGNSQTRPLLVAVVLGNIANAALDVVLIFWAGLGAIGAALSTTLVQTLMLGIYFAGVKAIEHGQGPRPRSTRADMMKIARYGLPVGGQLFAEVGIFAVATVLAAHIGTVAASGHTIALAVSSLTFSFAIGIASATSVRVGHAVGAGDLALARHRGVIGYKLGLVVMGCFAATFLAIPALLAHLFTAVAATVAATVPLLQIAALFQLSDGAQAIGAGALRGLGETRTTFVGNLIGHYAVGLPLVVGLAFAADLGAPGLWFGLSAGLTATALYLLARFLRSTSRSLRGSAGVPR